MRERERLSVTFLGGEKGEGRRGEEVERKEALEEKARRRRR